MTGATHGPERALFLLTDAESAERLFRVVGDLVEAGLREGTLLYVLPAGVGGEDPFLEEMRTWARRFETSGVRSISVALKRGDPSAWVRELSVMRPRQWVVVATPGLVPEGYLRPASPWRNLPVPVLLVPPPPSSGHRRLFSSVLVGVRDPEQDQEYVDGLVESLPCVRSWHGVHVRTRSGELRSGANYPIPLTVTTGDRYDIADNLLAATGHGASLLALFAQPWGADRTLPAGYVIEAVVRGTEIPVLLWPGKVGESRAVEPAAARRRQQHGRKPGSRKAEPS